MTTLASGIILYRRGPAGGARDEAPRAPRGPGTPGAGAARGAPGAPDATRGALLLLLRSTDTGQWGFAKGRRDEADAHEVATALREVREETGYERLVLHPAFRHVLEYTVRRPGGGDYPKRVVYFLAEAPSGEPRLSPEHDAALWADAAAAQERLAFGQLRDLARAVFELLAGA